MSNMPETDPVCERCGGPAIAHITGEQGEAGEVHHFCMNCALANAPGRRRQNRKLSHAAILMIVGLFVFAISAFADDLKFGDAEGFGRQQMAGITIAIVLVAAGAVLRAATVVVIGLVLGALTLLADWCGFGNSEGFGLHQQAGTVLGIVLTLAGLAVGRRGR